MVSITSVYGDHANGCDPDYVDKFVLCRDCGGHYKRFTDSIL